MNLTEILNTIRDNASEVYQERIPEATRDNITDIREVITDPTQAVVTNEFMSTLLNMLIKQVIHDKLFSDPLKTLKKGTKPLGDTVQEIYTNFIKGDPYDPKGVDLLNRKLPDTKAIYHRMNRQDKYKITVNREELYKAFSGYDKLESYIQTIINTLFNSSELDEFILIKQLFKMAYDNNAIKTVEVADPLLSESNGKKFIKTIKTVSGDMVYPSARNNAYLDAQDTDDKELITFSRKDEQILIIDNATEVSVNVDVLASLFNMSVAEFNDTRKITIDAFPDPNMRACLIDDQFLQVFDDLVFFTSFDNPEGLYRNYYLHVWQTLSYSILVNAVAFVVAADMNSDGQISEYTITKNLVDGVTLSNRRVKVPEGTDYLTTIRGYDATKHTIEILEGETDITEQVLVDDKISIEDVSGNITITVTLTE